MDQLEQEAYELQMQHLAETAWNYRRSDRVTAEKACKKLMQMAEGANDQESLAIGRLIRGLLALYISLQEEALVDIEQAHSYFSKEGKPIWQVRCLNTMGYAHVVAGTLGEALLYWNEGLRLSRRYKFDEMTGFLLYNLGDLQKSTFKRYEDALLCFTEALEYCKADVEGIAGKAVHAMCGPILASISDCHLQLGNTEKAMQFAEETIVMATRLNDSISIGLSTEMLASMYLKLGDFEKAEAFCLQSLEVRQRIDEKYAVANSLAVYAEIKIQKGDAEAALEHAQHALEILETLKSTAIIDWLYELMGRAYEALGDYKNSSDYYKRFAKAQADRINGELVEKLNLMTAEMRFEALKKDAEINKLKNVELRAKNEEIEAIAANLAETVKVLEETQAQLIRSEKMASLIGLVSGVAHEVNTPLGNGITTLSYIKDIQKKLIKTFDAHQLTRSTLQAYFENMGDAITILDNSLIKMAQIIRSFKKIGFHAKQDGFKARRAKAFLTEWELGLNQRERDRPPVTICCNENLQVTTDFDALVEILDELYNNVCLHGNNGSQPLKVNVSFKLEADEAYLIFSDNGAVTFLQEGQRLFEPFYRGSSKNAGMGIGLHMVYTLVTLALQGKIEKLDQPIGTGFEIRFKSTKA